MRICILSMQRVPNFGSLLQCYSLKKILTEMGHEVCFLDIEYRKHDDALMMGRKMDFSSESGRGGLIGKLHKIDRYAINRLRIKQADLAQNRLFHHFVECTLGVADPHSSYDLCIIGSDEVFNCASNAPWGFSSQLFGNVKNAAKVATYAASCGATTIDRVPEAVREVIRNAFKNVSAFSVRDTNTEQFVKSLTDQNVKRHLDPVVIGGFDEEIESCQVTAKVPDRYCIIYSYYNRINNPSEISAIKNFCKKHELEIVTVGAPQMWIKNHLVLTPFEALAVFKGAEFVVTDTFHGTIFSAKYAKNFITITRPSNVNKLTSLIADLHLEKHYAKDYTKLDAVYMQQKDQNGIDAIAQSARQDTMMYLNNLIASSQQ